ncbi:MBL fold metallo-hydrolase RNA specificity domain-containing protein [Pseudothauera rhizosphaerae]|uniref:MBL fold metallo-hydrolase n=1 Tax=Pseudothauera rhizosphaerae TaxID=2565932 RepID=A0A4S4AXM0_9RHOO|nr:MBL fold metallo-hydrolase [Pseudothauera rhizosphaerae]THF64383.1 MBL fold metallo-hydrolase [Pseudothauera rhizosphaerae]
MELTFHGAAGEVTGSCAHLRHEAGVGLIDCGMFQGGKAAVRKNLAALDFNLRALDFVLLTHAHLDHSGLVPRLAALGYRGPIHATAATVDLLEVMLRDAAHIQEKEAEWANRHERDRHLRRGWDAAPLYTVAQAEESLKRLRPHPYGQSFSPARGVTCTFHDAGHILGSAIIELDVAEKGETRKLVFSGDLGQPLRPVVRDPATLQEADYLCIESTYGDRAHRAMQETEDELVHALQHTLKVKRGNVIIPAFAVGRTQEVIFVLANLVRQGRVDNLEIVVDSPMAAAATELTLRHDELWDVETRELLAWMREHPGRASVRFVQDVEESIALNDRHGGLVIISASGMCDAGRIKYHLRNNLGRKECSIVIAGFQAAGSLGRRLVEGARHVTLFGERVPVRADIYTIGGLSAHADQAALLAWLGHFTRPPRRTFIVHGEQRASEAFREAVRTRYGWPGVTLPAAGEPNILA